MTKLGLITEWWLSRWHWVEHCFPGPAVGTERRGVLGKGVGRPCLPVETVQHPALYRLSHTSIKETN